MSQQEKAGENAVKDLERGKLNELFSTCGVGTLIRLRYRFQGEWPEEWRLSGEGIEDTAERCKSLVEGRSEEKREIEKWEGKAQGGSRKPHQNEVGKYISDICRKERECNRSRLTQNGARKASSRKEKPGSAREEDCKESKKKSTGEPPRKGYQPSAPYSNKGKGVATDHGEAKELNMKTEKKRSEERKV